MIRWALVGFVIAVISAVAALGGSGKEAQLSIDVAIAGFLFAVVVSLVTWISRDDIRAAERPRQWHRWQR
jgi:hypothetical protein